MALTLNEDSAECYFNLASAYKDKGDTGEAIMKFKMALKYDPQNPETFYELGCIYADMNDEAANTAAIDAFEKALQLNPDHEKAQERLAETKSRPASKA